MLVNCFLAMSTITHATSRIEQICKHGLHFGNLSNQEMVRDKGNIYVAVFQVPTGDHQCNIVWHPLFVLSNCVPPA